jgi:hypothetical protein
MLKNTFSNFIITIFGGVLMGLTSRKEEQLKNMPNIKSYVFRSKSGRFLVHKTVVTDIKPVQYYQAIVDDPVESQRALEEFQEELIA